jgi:hypothetical protein
MTAQLVPSTLHWKGVSEVLRTIMPAIMMIDTRREYQYLQYGYIVGKKSLACRPHLLNVFGTSLKKFDL